MNEQEAMQLREQIKQAFPMLHVDIHMSKPAGMSEGIHDLWVWEGETTLNLRSSYRWREQITAVFQS